MRSEEALKRVVDASEAVEVALGGVDTVRLEEALRLRRAAVGGLLEVLREQRDLPEGLDAPVAEVLLADSRLREAAALRLGDLRRELVQLGTGQRKLAQYGLQTRPEARFADRRE